MAEIMYNKGRLESILNDYSVAEKEAESIKEGINQSIAFIKEHWTGSDQVIGNRDQDFTKIMQNLENINNNLTETTKYLSNKNSNFAAASTHYNMVN